MQVYTPTSHETEAHAWASKQTERPRRPANLKALGLADSIADLTDTFSLVVGEAGPDWQHCTFTIQTLENINHHLRTAYRQALDIWSRGYSQGDNS